MPDGLVAHAVGRRPGRGAASSTPSRRFSATVSVGNTPLPPGISDRPRRAISSAGRRVMSRPSKVTLPLPGGQQAGDRLEHGRLAGAVGAEQGQQLVALDADVDAEQHLQRAVRRLDALAGEQVGAQALAAHAADHQPGARRRRGGSCRGGPARPPARRSRPRRASTRPWRRATTRTNRSRAQLERLGEAARDDAAGWRAGRRRSAAAAPSGTCSRPTGPAATPASVPPIDDTPPMTAIENTSRLIDAG